MGSRGAFNPSYGRTGGIPLSQRDYSCVGILGRIKIIQCDKKTNNPTTTYSNTSNTTYYSFSKENNRIERIYYLSQLEKVPSKQMGIPKCLLFKAKKHKKSHSA